MKYISSIALVLICTLGFAQNALIPFDELENEPAFSTMEEALANPTEVIRLDLSKSKIANLDYDFGKLVNLQWLDLSKNDIKEFPIAVTKLANLQYLDISKNEIGKIPDEIGALQNLKYLGMSKNKVYVISPEMGKLTNLETIDLWDNPIKSFPEELRGMTSLKLLDLRVTVINDAEQKKLMKMFPYTEIKFSKTCNCN